MQITNVFKKHKKIALENFKIFAFFYVRRYVELKLYEEEHRIAADFYNYL